MVGSENPFDFSSNSTNPHEVESPHMVVWNSIIAPTSTKSKYVCRIYRITVVSHSFQLISTAHANNYNLPNYKYHK